MSSEKRLSHKLLKNFSVLNNPNKSSQMSRVLLIFQYLVLFPRLFFFSRVIINLIGNESEIESRWFSHSQGSVSHGIFLGGISGDMSNGLTLIRLGSWSPGKLSPQPRASVTVTFSTPHSLSLISHSSVSLTLVSHISHLYPSFFSVLFSSSLIYPRMCWIMSSAMSF